MPRSFLRQGLDKEVHQVVVKLLGDESIEEIDVATVYNRIKRSNSSLSRKSKALLEDSIERILTVIQDDEEAGSDDVHMSEAVDIAIPEESTDSNAIIRRMMQSPKKSRDSSEIAGVLPVNTKKRSVAAASAGEQRQPKRSKQQKDLPSTEPPTHISLQDLGGVDHVINKFLDMVLMPLLCPQMYMKAGIKAPHGILLHGPPGCGKTMIAEALAGQLKLPFLKIDAPSIVSGMSGESEKALRQHFEHAMSIAPCLMFIDEIDAITPKRESASREMERRIVTQLLTCMDDLDLEKNDGKPVIVLAATNRPDSIDSALRRPGRFDEEISIGIPNDSMREQILKVQTRSMTLAPGIDFTKLAKATPGFVGADLVSLIFKASTEGQRRFMKALEETALRKEAQSDGESSTSPDNTALATFSRLQTLLQNGPLLPELENQIHITMQDFQTALPNVQPTAKREGFATIPDTTWENIGALQNVRKQLKSAIVEPIRNPEKYAHFGLAAQAGVLLWGPPGCGKTLLAKAVANESKANFISIKGPELLNKFVGESERAVRQVFFRARSSVPCVIFFDELDAIVPRRDDTGSEASTRVVNTLLTEMDGLGSRAGIYVIGATNRPDTIDAAMLRPGRLGKHLFVGLPGPEERVEVLRTILRGKPVKSPDDLAQFAKTCDRFSGADLGSLAAEAAQIALERNSREIELIDLSAAKELVIPSVDEHEMIKYSTWQGRSR